MRKKKIAVTMGDPAGIGPEVIVKALAAEPVREKIIPVVIGDGAVMEEAVALTGVDVEFRSTDDIFEPRGKAVRLLHVAGPANHAKGTATIEGGRMSVACIKEAVRRCLNGEVDAMVTAPISKEAIHLAGYDHPGHTEMIAELTGTRKVGMMFYGDGLKIILVTIHAPLRSAIEMITGRRVLETIRLAAKACEMLSIPEPRIAVSGLNPHAGEGGLFGDEEEKHITPSVKKALDEGIDVKGPYPPDIVFKRAYDGDFDIVVAMYHDQGLIPFKMLYFDKGVNVTVGLPIIRTSPDHGTAYDIAWKGTANPASMIEAILLAERLHV